MAPAVVETLIRRPIQGRPADLISSSNSACKQIDDYEYSRHPVHGQAYPGLVNWTSQSVSSRPFSIDRNGCTKLVRGLLYFNLTDGEMEQLDYFEGDQYAKELCNVQLVSNGIRDDTLDTMDEVRPSDALVQAMVYVWSNPISELDVSKDWSFDEFAQNHLSDYVITNVEPCRDEFEES